MTLIGILGDDERGARVRSLLDASPGIDAHLVVAPGRPTTTKERVRVDGRHVMRIDRERRDPPDAATTRTIEAATQDALDGAHALVVSDYAKGAVAPGLVDSLTGRPCTVVDPKHVDVERYRGADVLAPNRAEALAAAASVGPAGAAPTLDAAVLGLQARLPGTALVVTCGADGMVWSDGPREGDDELARVPSLARHVADVTGAGDSVVCGLAAALATGCELADAIGLATAIAAVAVASPGTAAPGWDRVEAVVGIR